MEDLSSGKEGQGKVVVEVVNSRAIIGSQHDWGEGHCHHTPSAATVCVTQPHLPALGIASLETIWAQGGIVVRKCMDFFALLCQTAACAHHTHPPYAAPSLCPWPMGRGCCLHSPTACFTTPHGWAGPAFTLIVGLEQRLCAFAHLSNSTSEPGIYYTALTAKIVLISLAVAPLRLCSSYSWRLVSTMSVRTLPTLREIKINQAVGIHQMEQNNIRPLAANLMALLLNV